MSPEQFLLFADPLPEPMLLLADDGLIYAANRAVGERLHFLAPGKRLADFVVESPDEVSHYLRLCCRSRNLVFGAMRFHIDGDEEIACRLEGSLICPKQDGAPALLLLRLMAKETAAGQFIALNQRIEELGKEVQRRRQAEIEIRQREEWLRVTLQSIGDGVICTDVQGRVTMMNPIAELLTGWTQDAAQGQPLVAVFPIINEQTRKTVENPVDKVLRDGVIVGLANHTLLLSRDGTERPIDDSAAPIRDESGKMMGVVLIFRDVTELRRSEQELLSSEARKSAILETALDCIITMDHEGQVVEFNPAAEKTFGYSRVEAIGQELASLIIPPSLREIHRQGMAHYLATGEGAAIGKRLELLGLRSDGTEFPIEFAIARIPAEDPPLFTAHLRDISERKRAEEELLDAHRQLEERVVERTVDLMRANEFLNILLENVQTGVVACDAEGILTMFNGVTRELHGLPEEPIPPDRWASRYRLYRSDGQTPMTTDEIPLFRALQGERVQDTEMVIAPIDAPPRSVLTSGQAFFDAQGEKLGAVVSMQDITARKQAEAALRVAYDELERRVEERTEELGRANAALEESEKEQRAYADRLSLALSAADLGDWSWDAASDLVTLSDRAEEAFGIPPGTLLTWTAMQDLLHPADRERARREVERVLVERVQYDIEYRMNGRDGPHAWVGVLGRGIYDASDQVVGMYGIVQNITVRKALEESLRSSEERLRLALDAGRMGVWDWNIRTGDLKWSDSLEPLHGLAPGTFGGTMEHFQELIHPDDREMVSTAIRQALESCGEYYIELRNRRPNGGIHWIASSGKVFHGDDGLPLRMVGIGLDVTQRKRTEQTARFLADASASLAVMVDFNSTLQKISSLAVPSFADWATVDVAEVDGSLRRVSVSHIDPAKIQLAHEIHRRFPPDPEAPQGIWNILRTGKSEMVQEITDDLLVRSAKDPEQLHILREWGLKSYIGVPLRVRGKTLGVITFISSESAHSYDHSDLAVAEDLVSRAAIAIENSQLYRELRDADQRKDEFLATLAHELRNPLAPIRNGLQVMRLSSPEDDAMAETRAMMERQLNQMIRLVDDLLDVSRISSDKLDLKKNRIELLTAVQSALETSRPLIEQAGHSITVTLPPKPVYLDADLTRLAQVFSNLLTNSAKYTPPGGHIWLTTKVSDDEVSVRVRDNGLGIPAESLPTLFQMFSQVDRNIERSQGGLGIGLSLVKRLVEMHGGTVEAHSDGPGRGSEFTVRLPVPDTISPTATVQGEMPQSVGVRRRILVVDDNQDSALSLEMLLQIMGNDTRTAHDGLAAVAAAQEFLPDMILLDIGLPKIDGYEACRRIREQPWSCGMEIIALTGWGQEEDHRRSKEAGFDHHLIKPIQPAVLQKLLENADSSFTSPPSQTRE